MRGATVVALAKRQRCVTGRHRTSSPEAVTTNSISAASFDSASDSPRHRPRRGRCQCCHQRQSYSRLGAAIDAMERPPRWGERSPSPAEVWSGRAEGLGTGERPQVPSTMWRSHEVRPRRRLPARGRVKATAHNATILSHRTMIRHAFILPQLVGRRQEARLQLPGGSEEGKEGFFFKFS